MAQSYAQLQKQIEKLQRKADALRQSEVKGVVERIKIAISHYGLTAAHLGLGAANSAAAQRSPSKAARKSGPAFGDDQGNVWSGRGPRPRWLKEALSNGRSIDDFRIGQRAVAAAAGKAGAPKLATRRKGAKRAASKMRFSDGAGNSWGGRGPRPRWLKEALAAGRDLKDFAKEA